MSHDSLFGSDDGTNSDGSDLNEASHNHRSNPAKAARPEHFNGLVASIDTPEIKGFYLMKNLISVELQETLLRSIFQENAVTQEHPQAMLFPRASSSRQDIESCPIYLQSIVKVLPALLKPHLTPEDFDIVFEESLSLQTILNLYEPGQGITPHVDLPHRYAHPIIGISLASAIVMEFHPTEEGESRAVLLNPGDVYVLLHEARYNYKHGIPYRDIDYWLDREGEVRKLYRGTRVSITFRRMLENCSQLHVSQD